MNGKEHLTMGHSIAWYEDNELLIETKDYSPGIIFTSSGVPQGENGRSLERFYQENDKLFLTISYTDPDLYEETFNINYEFRIYPENELLEYGCLLENASYEYE